MNHIKKYNEGFFDIFKKKNVINQTVQKSRHINKPKKININDMIEYIKEFFVEMEDKYRIELDPDGDYYEYTANRYRKDQIPVGEIPKLRYFIDIFPESRLFIRFNIASIKPRNNATPELFYTEEFLEDLDKFKSRIGKIGCKCEENIERKEPYVKILHFNILIDFDAIDYKTLNDNI